MRAPLTEEDLVERAAIDGRVAFAVVAFLALAGGVALLDRVGAPEGVVRLMGPLGILAALATIGVLLRSMRVSRFYAAGRAVPTPYVGFAAVAICVGLALPFVPPGGGQAMALLPAAGAGVGLVVALLVLAPFLRKTGAFSVVDLVGARFPNVALRLGLAVTVATIGALIGLAGFDLATGPLTQVLGLSRAVVAAGLAFVLVLVAAPGGVLGIVWAANGAAGVLVAALALPIGLLLARGDMPAPFADASPVWREAGAQVLAWQAGVPAVDGVLAGIGAALVTAALLPLLTAPVAARDGAAAVRGGLLAVLWSVPVGCLIVATVLWGTAVFSRAVVGQAPDRLPEAIYAASGAGLVDVCGARAAGPADARTACTAGRKAGASLSASDATPRSPLVLADFAAAAGAGAAGVGLIAAALLAVGLSVAAAGFLLCATALGHDLFYRVQNKGAQTSRRLAVTRALLVVTVALGAALTGGRPLDPRLLIGLAGTLAASAILPLLVLAVHPRAIGRDAVIALLVGLTGAEAVLFSRAPTTDVLLRAAFVGFGCGVVAGLLASLVSRGDRTDSRAFVDAVLHRPGDVLAPDKGA